MSYLIRIGHPPRFTWRQRIRRINHRIGIAAQIAMYALFAVITFGGFL